MNKISKEQLEAYGANYAVHGPTPRGTFQNNYETQSLRYARLLSNLSFTGEIFSVHDVGAGIADLHRYMLEEGIPHEYSGTEIVPDMVRVAKEMYPSIDLHPVDFLSADHEPNADFILLSGTLNLSNGTDPGQWMNYCCSVIEKMYRCARFGIAFNFLTNRNTFSNDELFYADPVEIFNFCLNKFERFVSLDHSYPLYEFTITVLKPEHVRARNLSDAFSKYFSHSYYEKRVHH